MVMPSLWLLLVWLGLMSHSVSRFSCRERRKNVFIFVSATAAARK